MGNMQVELESNIYIQTLGNDEITIVYVNETLATFKISNEMNENELAEFGFKMLNLLKNTPKMNEYLLKIKKEYKYNPARDGKIYLVC